MSDPDQMPATVTIRWETEEVTKYERTFDLAELNLPEGVDVAEFVLALAAGDAPAALVEAYNAGGFLLAEHEDDGSETEYACVERDITAVFAGP